MTGSLYARLTACLPDDPTAEAMETADGTRISFAALTERAGRFAAVLAEAGAGPGERVCVQVDKSVDAVALYLGALQAGAVYVPLNTGYTPAEIDHFVDDAAPRVLVCAPAAAPALGAAVKRVGAALLTLGAAGEGTLAARAGEMAPRRDAAGRDGGDVAALLYTSGTTGRSKGAMLTHDSLWSNARTLYAAWGIRPGDVLIHALPLYHTHGLFVALNLMLMNGGRLILLPGFDAERVIDLMPRATVLMGVPTFYTRLLASPRLDRTSVAGIRLFVSGSAPLAESTHRAFEARTGQRILERYGMTETGMNASNPLDGERRPGTVGPALPGVSLRVCDAAGQVLGPGEIGGLEVRGPNVFKGYWRMPEKTAAEFREGGWFVTGDLASIGPDGYVTIVGRSKDLIISGGLNIYPKEIEAAIDALPGVAESAVIGVPHPDFGEAVVAVVAAKDDPGDIVAALRSRLAPFKLPKHVHLTDTLPRNAMGKVQKAALRERFSGLFA